MSYTQVQFIAYCIHTGPKETMTDDGKHTFYSYRGMPAVSEDIEQRISLVETALKQAHGLASKEAGVLKIFMMPEFFFRGKAGAYEVSDATDIINSLQNLVKSSQWKDWLFIFGTIISMPNPNNKKLKQEVYNTALIQKGGFESKEKLKESQDASDNARLVLKEFKADGDFLTKNSSLNANNLISERVLSPLNEHEYRLEKLLWRMINANKEELSSIWYQSELSDWNEHKKDLEKYLNSINKHAYIKLLRNPETQKNDPLYTYIQKYLQKKPLLLASISQAKRYLTEIKARYPMQDKEQPSQAAIETLDELLKITDLSQLKTSLNALKEKPEEKVIEQLLKNRINSDDQQLLTAKPRSEVQVKPYDGASVFDFKPQGIDNIIFGLEICRDHVKKRLANSSNLPPIDIQLVSSYGMTLKAESIVAKKGGYVFICDGKINGPKDKKFSYSRAIQSKTSKEMNEEAKTLNNIALDLEIEKQDPIKFRWIDLLYAKGAGELNLYKVADLPELSLSETKSMLPNFSSAFNYTPSDAPTLLNGMKVLFEQSSGVYPVRLLSRSEKKEISSI